MRCLKKKSCVATTKNVLFGFLELRRDPVQRDPGGAGLRVDPPHPSRSLCPVSPIYFTKFEK